MTESEEFAAFSASVVSEMMAAEPRLEPEKTEEPKEGEQPAEEKKPDDKVEAKPEPKKEEKPVEKKDWAELARKERERRQQKAQAKLEASRREQELADAKAKAAQLEELMKLSKEDRLAALEKLGMTLDDANRAYVDKLERSNDSPAVLAAQRELAELRATIAELKSQVTDVAKERAEAAKKQREAEAKQEQEKIAAKYITTAADAIKAKSDDYELLSKHPKGSEVVFHYLAAHYAQTATLDEAGNLLAPGEELEIHEACRRVEEALVDEFRPFADAKKLRTAGKPSDSTTLSGDMRQSEPRTEPAADDDGEFLRTTLRLLKTQTA